MCDFDSDFSIEVHLGASCLDFMENSLRGHSTKLGASCQDFMYAYLDHCSQDLTNCFVVFTLKNLAGDL